MGTKLSYKERMKFYCEHKKNDDRIAVRIYNIF